jgi:hypothetical protein
MSAPAITDELLTLADAIGDVKTRFEKLEAEFSTQARPLEAAATALQASLAGIKALQFHVIDNNLGALSQRVEEQRRAVDEQIGVIVTELRKADDDNRTTLGASKEELAQQIAGLQTQIGQLHTRFSAELDRVQLEAKSKVEALALLPGPQGAQGASVKPRGAYDQNTAYSKLEIVSWMGGSYISNADDNREKPGAKAKNWTMLASRGGPGGGSGDITGLTGVALPAQIVSGASTYTVGDILYANSTGTLAKLPAGSANLVLKSNGAGSAPAWAATTDSVAATAAEAAAGTSDSVFVTPATGALAAANAVNPRAPSQGLVFDGTAGATVSGIPAFGTGDFTLAATVLPTSLGIMGVMGGAANALSLYLIANGTFRVGKVDVEDYTASTGVLVAGKFAHVAAVRSGATVTYYLNGVACGTADVTGKDFTAGLTVVGRYSTTGYTWSGSIKNPIAENRALTAAEVLALYESGAPAAADYKDSTQTLGTPINSVAADQNFSSDTGYWTKTNATISGGACNLTGAANANIAKAAILKTGKRYRVTLNVTTGDANMYISDASVTTLAGVTSTGVQSFDVTGGLGGGFQLVSPAGTAVIDDLTITPIGLLLAPEAAAPGNGYQWKDMSGNKADITLPAAGVAWALPDRRPNSVRGTLTWAGSSEWKTVIGQRSLPNDAVITLLTLRGTANTTGSGTKVSSNNTDGRWSAAAAISANTKVVRTLANQLPAGTADADCDIAVDPDTNNYTGSIEIEAFYSLSQ